MSFLRSPTLRPPAISSSKINRRVAGAVVTLIAVVIVAAIAGHLERSLGRPDWWTGGVTLGGLIVLVLLGLRRRLPLLGAGSMATWTRVHLYVGLFTLAVYVLHVPAILAGGVLEGLLSILFLAVSGSGIYGLYISRTLPRRLTAIPGEHRFDQIDWHRRQILLRSESEIESLPDSDAATLLRNHHDEQLRPYFASQPNWWALLRPRPHRRRRLLRDLSELGRYLDEQPRRVAGQISGLVRLRDDLDYRHALQWRLRAWVIVHGAGSLLLIGLAVLHVGLVVRVGR